MYRYFEMLDRLCAERRALLRERDELLTRGSEAMREIQSLRAKPVPVVRRASSRRDPAPPADRSDRTAQRPPARMTPSGASTPAERRRVPLKQGPADLA